MSDDARPPCGSDEYRRAKEDLTRAQEEYVHFYAHRDPSRHEGLRSDLPSSVDANDVSRSSA